METLKTLEEAAAILNIDVKFLYELLAERAMPVVMMGIRPDCDSVSRISPEDLRTFIEHMKVRGIDDMYGSRAYVPLDQPFFKPTNETPAEGREPKAPPFGPARS